jgi:small subunit ribosomal protein S18
MAPPNRRKGPPKAGDQRGPRPPRRGKPKFCIFCAQHTEWVDYKDVNLLRRFLSDRGKIRSRENTGTCAQHQREVAVAIKTARELALLPYAVRVPVADRPGGRGGRGGPRGNAARPARTDGDLAAAGTTPVEGDTDQQAAIDVGQAPAGDREGGEAEGQAPTTPAAES